MRKLDLNYIDPDPTIGDWGWAQRPFIAEIERQYNAGKPVRIIVLKARQLGISTATEAVLFLWSFFHRGTNGLVLSYEDGQAQELFQMTKLYWDTWPHRGLYTLLYSTRRQLRWHETKSNLRVATAKNIGGARGSTLHALHGSEVALWPEPESLWGGMKQTIPRRHSTIVILESTARGMNWFHDMWESAESGESEFVPVFFPWYHHPAYRMHTTLTVRSELDPEERELLRLMSRDDSFHTVLTDDQCYAAIAFRRWSIINDCNGDVTVFHEEYPSTPEEAFVTSGKPIFSPLHLQQCYEELSGVRGYFRRHGGPSSPVSFEPDPSGNWTLYRKPSHRHFRSDRFFVAGDPSETIAGDPGCIQVLDRRTFEQVAVWHGRVTPVYFAREMMMAGDFYQHGMLCPEVEGGGQAAIGAILVSGYDNVWRDKRPDRQRESFNVYGWSTNWQRKNWCIGDLQRSIVDHSLVIHDQKTYRQLRNYVERANGDWGNSDPKIHDDAVMAMAIAVTASGKEGVFMPDDERVNPYLDIYRSEWEDDYDMFSSQGT